jgi:hypothetical protein
MHGQQLSSCANCWFNGLQSGSVGLSVGYCTQHRVVLRQPDETTCALQLRQDLLIDGALQQSRLHRAAYQREDGVQRLADLAPAANGDYVDPDTSFIRHDRVAAVVADYGEYGTKIESLAQLCALRSFRAELAMLCLGRGYVHRCVSRDGSWTSGIHLLWWTRQRLSEDLRPELQPADLRYQMAVSLDRQIDLARWWLLMLRLVFISDLGTYADGNGGPEGELAGLAEQAAADTGIPALAKLASWTQRVGIPAIDRCFPEQRYRQLALELHRD